MKSPGASGTLPDRAPIPNPDGRDPVPSRDPGWRSHLGWRLRTFVLSTRKPVPIGTKVRWSAVRDAADTLRHHELDPSSPERVVLAAGLPDAPHQITLHVRNPNHSAALVRLEASSPGIRRDAYASESATAAPVLLTSQEGWGVRLFWSAAYRGYRVESRPAGPEAAPWQLLQSSPFPNNGRFEQGFGYFGSRLFRLTWREMDY